MHGSGNRGGRERQGIHGYFQFPELFFGAHPELLFFVNDQKTQVFELDFGAYDLVGSNQDIDPSRFQIRKHGFDFGGGAETIQIINPHRQAL